MGAAREPNDTEVSKLLSDFREDMMHWKFLPPHELENVLREKMDTLESSLGLNPKGIREPELRQARRRLRNLSELAPRTGIRRSRQKSKIRLVMVRSQSVRIGPAQSTSSSPKPEPQNRTD